MAETIFLLNNAGELVEMTETGHLTENDFQKLLADYPKLISGDQIDKENPRRWLLISREIGIADAISSGNRWSLDHLFIDQDGIPTLVEVKRSSDTRLRREVIGQILDYAANAVSYWSIDEILSKFEKTCEAAGKNAEAALDEFLKDSFYKDKFWDTVHTNLKAGKIRLLIVADIIPREMQRIIEFLNEQMSPCEILGLEIKQFLGKDLKTLVPRVIGATVNAKSQKTVRTGAAEQWNEERFFSDITNKDSLNLRIYRILYVKSKELFDDILWGFGKSTGSFSPFLNVDGQVNKMFIVYTYGSIEILFENLKTKPPFNDESKRRELLQKTNIAFGKPLASAMDKIDKRPSYRINELNQPKVMEAFFEVVKWYIDTVRSHYNKIS
jgi:hypothetical protein